jgi:hypothetical protein
MFRVIKRLRAVFGYDEYSAETFDRLLRSEHVTDLRWIVTLTTCGAGFAIAVIVLISCYVYPTAQQGGGSKVYELLVPFQISAVLAGLGGIIAWCYQTGSARLGIVDLIACEITTLCRICTISRTIDSCIEAFELDIGGRPALEQSAIDEARSRFAYFDSSERYAPVFDNNAKELRSLSVRALTNVTAFYTYWKGTRDAFRRLAHTSATAYVSHIDTENNPWHRAMRDIIYMQFLACESGRRAIRDLIEFEPNSAENTINVLLSELPAYGFLVKYFREVDVRYHRIALRRSRYEEIVPDVYYLVDDMHSKYQSLDMTDRMPVHRRRHLKELRRDWEKAHRMLKDLVKYFEAAIGPFPSKAEHRVRHPIEGGAEVRFSKAAYDGALRLFTRQRRIGAT